MQIGRCPHRSTRKLKIRRVMLDLNHDFVSPCPEKLAYVMLTENALVDPRKENLKRKIHMLQAAVCAELRWLAKLGIIIVM